MFLFKVTTFCLMALVVRAEKKIELQDIEEDNLRSEMRSELDKDHDKSDSPQSSGSVNGPDFNSLDFMKSGFLKLLESPQPTAQAQRYVHQYAVTEQPERQVPIPNKAHFGPSAPQQAMVGYLSNMPMQIYLVPQYYSDPQSAHHHINYQPPGLSKLSEYQADAVQTQNNYIEAHPYDSTGGKTYIQHYAPPQTVTYVTYQSQPTPTPQATAEPLTVAYQVPVLQYNSHTSAPTKAPKPYYANPEYTDDLLDRENVKQYSTHTETSTRVPTAPEYTRHYNSRAPLRHPYRPHVIHELPRPNPLLLQASPPHLAHLPKTLPMYRPFQRPVYPENDVASSTYTPRPHDHYTSSPYTRRPTSLLDSYIPSSVQVEYLKRGLVKDPLSAYEALASGRLPLPIPRDFERGFLPNQMYHTGAGGITYGPYKRTPKFEKTHRHDTRTVN